VRTMLFQVRVGQAMDLVKLTQTSARDAAAADTLELRRSPPSTTASVGTLEKGCLRDKVPVTPPDPSPNLSTDLARTLESFMEEVDAVRRARNEKAGQLFDALTQVMASPLFGAALQALRDNPGAYGSM
jgi:hypothetical protein